MPTRWIRFEHAGASGFGTLDGQRVHACRGDMFGASEPTGAVLALADVTLRTPTAPSKVIGLWNNFRALGEKLNLAAPPEPLYFLKAPGSFVAGGEPIRAPAMRRAAASPGRS